MEITFEDQKVKALFDDLSDVQNCKRLMVKAIGAEYTKKVKIRYVQLSAAETFDCYLKTNLGKPHSLSGEFEGCYKIDIAGNMRIIVKPITENNDISAEALRKCNVIEIRGVVDYHGSKNDWIIP